MQSMQLELVQTTAARRRVFRVNRGRSEAYPTPQAFAEEAERMGFSIALPSVGVTAHESATSVRLGDVILFTTFPQDFHFKKKAGDDPANKAPAYLFGWGVVERYLVYAKDAIGKELLEELFQLGEREGWLTIFRWVDAEEWRRCGHYRIGRQAAIADEQAFESALARLVAKKRVQGYIGMVHSHLGRLAGGKFHRVEPPVVLGEYRWWRGIALVTDTELSLLLQGLEGAAMMQTARALIDAIEGSGSETKGELWELVEYVRETVREQTPKHQGVISSLFGSPVQAVSEVAKGEGCVVCGGPVEGDSALCPTCRQLST